MTATENERVLESESPPATDRGALQGLAMTN